jgi:hypothetical protein
LASGALAAGGVDHYAHGLEPGVALTGDDAGPLDVYEA